MNFILSFFSYIFVFMFFLLPLVVYRCWYPKCITCLRVQRGSSPVVCPVKPNKSFFRGVSLNRDSSFVSIGNGYYAYYCAADPDSDFVNYQQISISDEIYIFSRSRLGRFRSVDLSDRCLFDSIKKIIEN